jgi:DNA-binding GntR family transcriptional regulator
MMRDLLEQMERLFHVGLLLTDRNNEMHHERRELIEALKAGDADDAEAVAAAQIATSKTMVVNALLTNTSLDTVSISPA